MANLHTVQTRGVTATQITPLVSGRAVSVTHAVNPRTGETDEIRIDMWAGGDAPHYELVLQPHEARDLIRYIRDRL